MANASGKSTSKTWNVTKSERNKLLYQKTGDECRRHRRRCYTNVGWFGVDEKLKRFGLSWCIDGARVCVGGVMFQCETFAAATDRHSRTAIIIYLLIKSNEICTVFSIMAPLTLSPSLVPQFAFHLLRIEHFRFSRASFIRILMRACLSSVDGISSLLLSTHRRRRRSANKIGICLVVRRCYLFFFLFLLFLLVVKTASTPTDKKKTTEFVSRGARVTVSRWQVKRDIFLCSSQTIYNRSHRNAVLTTLSSWSLQYII